MEAYPLPLELVIESTPQRFSDMRSGSQFVKSVLEVVQNDAGVLYDVLQSVNTADPGYKKLRRSISRHKADLKPFRNMAESIMTEGTHAIGQIKLTITAAERIKDVITNPPENLRFLGATSDTLVMLEDKLEALIKQAKDDGQEAKEEPEIIETPPVT